MCVHMGRCHMCVHMGRCPIPCMTSDSYESHMNHMNSHVTCEIHMNLCWCFVWDSYESLLVSHMRSWESYDFDETHINHMSRVEWDTFPYAHTYAPTLTRKMTHSRHAHVRCIWFVVKFISDSYEACVNRTSRTEFVTWSHVLTYTLAYEHERILIQDTCERFVWELCETHVTHGMLVFLPTCTNICTHVNTKDDSF